MSNLIPFSIDNTSFNGVTRLRYSQVNFLANADFENWNNGTSVAPPAWTASGGVTVAQQTALSIGTYSAQLTFDATNTGIFYQNVPSSTAVNYTYTCYVQRTTGTGTANLVARNADTPTTIFATCALNTTGGIGLAALTFQPSAGANIRFSIEASSAATSTWLIDECMVQESQAVASAFTRAAIDDSTNQFVFGTKTFGGGMSAYSLGLKLYDGSSTYPISFAATGTAAGSATLSYPVTTDTLVARATTDTLTNKTIDTGSSNTIKILGQTLTSTASNTGTIFIPSTSSTITLAGVSSTQTLTNKRITRRVLALSANSATPAVNTDSFDVVHITAQSAAITGFTMTGTPVDGDLLRVSITGTGSVAITWGTSFEASTVALPTTTSSTTRLDVGFAYNTETSKWRCLATA